MAPDRFEVLVVDCSTDDTFDVLVSAVADVPYRVVPLRTSSNRGPAAAFDACNIFYRRVALERTGGFDEQMVAWWSTRPGARCTPLAWGEDTAAGWSAVEAGRVCGFVPGAVVSHDVEPRGWSWHVRYGYLDRMIIALAVQHPDIERRRSGSHGRTAGRTLPS